MSHRLTICIIILLLGSTSLGMAGDKGPDDDRNPAGQIFQDCDDCPSMIVVSEGRFTMGSPDSEEDRDEDEGPQRSVNIAKFAVGRFEVTFAEWDACVEDGGCGGYKPEDKGWGRGKRPVMNVSWNRAKSYVAWLSQKTGKPYTLLTEAEWEYAARAGTTSAYATGETISAEQARFSSGSSAAAKQTATVGSFKPNAFGLHDMHGNVWEWVEDCWHQNYDRAPKEGSAWFHEDDGSCDFRMYRGGSWYNAPEALRSANRTGSQPGFSISNIGFRVARTLGP